MPDIEAIRVPVPPIEEQDEIVEAVWERLRTFDAADDLLRRQIDLLLERRQALITATVNGELDVAEAA
jgi:type I restriction enzyme S subunit